MLFYTMYNSAWDVLAYLLCIMLLFTGYMSFGYLVFGPYHVKVSEIEICLGNFNTYTQQTIKKIYEKVITKELYWGV